MCLDQKAFYRGRDLFIAASSTAASRLKFATFTALDSGIENLKENASEIMRAARATLKAIKIDSYALKFETHVDDWFTGYHGHAHAIVSTPAAGKGYISADGWHNAWHDQLRPDLHQVEGGTHVERVYDLGGIASYTAKSAYAKSAIGASGVIGRIVDGLVALKGMPRFELRGSFVTT